MEKFDPLKEIELTLSSLDDLKEVKAPEGFLDELTSKMVFQAEATLWVRRAKFAIAAMFALAVLNSVLLFQNSSTEREDMLDSVATEWNLSIED